MFFCEIIEKRCFYAQEKHPMRPSVGKPNSFKMLVPQVGKASSSTQASKSVI